MQIAGMLTMERGIEAAKVGSQDAVRLVGKRQHRKGIRIDERRERVHARKFLRIDWFHVIFGQRPAFGESPSQNLNSRYSEIFEKVEYHKALGGRGDMGYIPRCLSDGAISSLRLCGPGDHIREHSLEFLNEFGVWLLGVVSEKEAISILYCSETGLN